MQKNRLPLILALLAVALLSTPAEALGRRRRRRPPPPPPPPPHTTHNLNVQNHAAMVSPVDNARAAAIFQDASAVMQNRDGSCDVDCPVTLTLNGNVGTFNVGNGTINTEPERLAVFGVPGQIKVVNEINFCANTFNIGFIGCGDQPGSTFVVERYILNQEGILWLHEFGHNRGLGHRNDPFVVMNPTILPTAREVNAPECGAYR